MVWELWERRRTWEYDRQPSCRTYGIEWAKVWRASVGAYNEWHHDSLLLLPAVVPALSSMTLISTNASPSIFEHGELRPGIYKIQNIYSETFLDIEVHSRDVRCRPAGSLGEGRGIVSRHSLSGVHVSDYYKW